MSNAPAWLAIAGPTASGKTALALAVAARLPCEIISVDSALVYRGMDIGTAKPSAAEQRAVPHHLIDILDPTQAYSAAAFVRDATRLVHDIRARGRMPLLVGGTMLYFKALFEGLDEMPAAQPELRQQLEARAHQQGWPALHAELTQVDPTTAARLAPNDAQRIGRALEVYLATGQTLSSLHQRQGIAEGHLPCIDGLPGRLLSLEPQDRRWLHDRIAQRFDAMLAAGFVDEMQRLRQRQDLHPALPAMRCVGYRQAWELMDAAATHPLDARGLARLRELGIFATRQLAKRQITWLRGMHYRDTLPCDLPELNERAIHWLQKLGAPMQDCP